MPILSKKKIPGFSSFRKKSKDKLINSKIDKQEIESNTEALEKLTADYARFIVLTEDNKAKEKGIDDLNQEIIILLAHCVIYYSTLRNIALLYRRSTNYLMN